MDRQYYTREKGGNLNKMDLLPFHSISTISHHDRNNKKLYLWKHWLFSTGLAFFVALLPCVGCGTYLNISRGISQHELHCESGTGEHSEKS